MKRTIVLLVIGLVLWNVGGLWVHHQVCCGAGAGLPQKSLLIQDDNFFYASAVDNIQFEADAASYTLSTPVRAAYQKTAQYLQSHPNKQLSIIAAMDSLTQARGKAIQQLLLEEGVPLYQVPLKTQEASGIEYSFGSKAAFNITQQDLNLKGSDNFVFGQSNFELVTPISKELDGQFQALASYLKAHPKQQLNIIGQYTPKEENPSTLANLGNARANKIKSILVNEYGVEGTQVVYKSQVKDTLTTVEHPNFKQNLILGAILWEWETLATNPTAATTKENTEALVTLEKRLLGNPKQLYFEVGKNKVLIDEAFRTYFEEVLYYLERSPNTIIECSGHTDNSGNKKLNQQLGLERAQFVASFLRKQGVARDRVNAISLGQNRPIASNGTAAGRAKNRRVEVVIKQMKVE